MLVSTRVRKISTLLLNLVPHPLRCLLPLREEREQAQEEGRKVKERRWTIGQQRGMRVVRWRI